MRYRLRMTQKDKSETKKSHSLAFPFSLQRVTPYLSMVVIGCIAGRELESQTRRRGKGSVQAQLPNEIIYRFFRKMTNNRALDLRARKGSSAITSVVTDYMKTMTPKAWEEFKQARSFKKYLIRKVSRKAFRAFIAEACESPEAMWKKTKWSRDPIPRQTFLPPLKKGEDIIDDPKAKADLLLETFFPPPVQAELGDIKEAEYPEPYTIGDITEYEIVKAIMQAPPKKAPGNDGILNMVFKEVIDIILPALHKIFNSCLANGYCPNHFRDSITIVLRKPKKDDYSNPKSYRPIALLNTIGKALEFIIAQRIAYLAETYSLLPDTHMGGRKLRSSEHGIHYIIERVYMAWNKAIRAALLLVDITGAYDRVAHPRLIHDLKRKGIDTRIVNWTASFLKNRTTTLQTPEYTTDSKKINCGIPQGSPLSPILFLFYNSELIEKCNSKTDLYTKATGFVDDIGFVTTKGTPEENCRLLERVHKEICEPWAKTHGSQFAPQKYQLLHMDRAGKTYSEQSITIEGKTIQPKKKSVTYLGLKIDGKLSWGEQITAIKEKAAKSIGALARIAGST